jgi:hypothetical protein
VSALRLIETHVSATIEVLQASKPTSAKLSNALFPERVFLIG